MRSSKKHNYLNIRRKVFHFSYTFQSVKFFDQVINHERLHWIVTLRDISNITRNITPQVDCIACINKTNRAVLFYQLEFLIIAALAELNLLMANFNE